MKRLLLDTSYLVAHFNPDDSHHEAALEIQDEFMRGRWEALLLLDSVFAETVTVLMSRHSYARAKESGEPLRNSEEIHWVSMGDHMDETWYQFLAQPRGDMSIVDCALVAVADAFGVEEIASFDKGFDHTPGLKRVP